MKIKIKSYYTYDNNMDDYVEEIIDAIITRDDEKKAIEYAKGYIIVENNRITQKRDNTIMIIEAKKMHKCIYKTEQGDIELNINGISVESFEVGKIICKAEYTISNDIIKPYKVKLEIIEE